MLYFHSLVLFGLQFRLTNNWGYSEDTEFPGGHLKEHAGILGVN